LSLQYDVITKDENLRYRIFEKSMLRRVFRGKRTSKIGKEKMV
jgi:hypothetical protein